MRPKPIDWDAPEISGEPFFDGMNRYSISYGKHFDFMGNPKYPETISVAFYNAKRWLLESVLGDALATLLNEEKTLLVREFPWDVAVMPTRLLKKPVLLMPYSYQESMLSNLVGSLRPIDSVVMNWREYVEGAETESE